MIGHQGEYALPIQPRGSGVENVHDVGAIKALARQHEQLGSEQLFSSENASRNVEDDGGMGALDPGAIHAQRAITHAGDQVNKKVVAVRLGQPYRVGHLAIETMLAQTVERGWRRRWSRTGQDLWCCAICRCGGAARRRLRPRTESCNRSAASACREIGGAALAEIPEGSNC